MNHGIFILKSAWFYRRAHLGVLLGTLLAAVILSGARLVGDSVKYSLRQIAAARLGAVRYALNLPSRWFHESLAERLRAELDAEVAPVLGLDGVALREPEGGGRPRQINRVRVLGVDARFWRFGAGGPVALGAREAALNEKLARALEVRRGDVISVRVRRPGLLPEDAPLSARGEHPYVRAALTVAAVVSDPQLGPFSLEANQAVPYNLFVPLAWLQTEVQLGGKANILLAGEPRGAAGAAAVNDALRRAWRIEDSGVRAQPFERLGLVQVSAERIFLDRETAQAAGSGAAGEAAPVGALTYLVTSISKEDPAGTRRTPYSFVTALSPSANGALSVVPPGMGDGDIILNRWTADQLAAGPGGEVRVSYLRLQPDGRFADESRTFRVLEVVPMEQIEGERELMPSFPGLSDVERCADWDIGLPMNEAALSDAGNEAYWERYRATPKAFVTLRAGQAMWGSRFGDLMTVRYAAEPGPAGAPRERVVLDALTRAVDPAAVGFSLAPVWDVAQRAVADGTDLGSLFLGMSTFLIAAALALTALLFVFGLQQRARQFGVLRAAGYRPRRILALILLEGLLPACVGALAGAPAAVLYSRALIWGLSGPWRPAVAGTAIRHYWEPATLAWGAAAAIVCAAAAMAVVARRFTSRSVNELLTTDFSQAWSAAAGRAARSRTARPAAVAAVAAAAGLVMAVLGARGRDPAATFFLAGACLLLAGLCLAHALLGRQADPAAPLTLWRVSLRNAARRRGRSLTLAAVFACGTFLVFAVSSMQLGAPREADAVRSGTGGCELLAETALPILDDPGEAAGRKRLGLDRSEEVQRTAFVPVKVFSGDDAGCLNLNRAQRPRLLGVDTGRLRGRFGGAAGGASDPWPLLERPLPDGVTPALAADLDTLTWSLKKRADAQHGDDLVYRDEQGRAFRIRLVGALPHRLNVFHGSLLISMRAFTERFPAESGYRLFLLDTPAGAQEAVRLELNERLANFGFDATPSASRLRELGAVENTYLAVFLALGGLGLLLGSAGVGIVVLRNVTERRGELGMLAAVGYRLPVLRRMLWLEHGLLLAVGLACGTLAAAVAIIPAFRYGADAVPLRGIVLTFAGIAAAGAAWTWLAAWAASRGDLIGGLRSE